MLGLEEGGNNGPVKVYRYAVLAAILLACGLCWRLLPVPGIAGLQRLAPKLERANTQPRRIYPYSVIVGGAYSGEELARARKVDSVVERHYAGFSSSTTVQRMPADTLMYVSYRKSNRVFWTKAKHRIPKGEKVLCDGDNLARTRCGNRLSLKPQAPVSSEDEPTEEAMDVPDLPKAPLLASSPTSSAPDADFFVPVSPSDLNSLLSPLGLNAPPFVGSPVLSGSERPYAFGSPPGAGPFLGNSLAYPAIGNTANAANATNGGTGGTSPGSGGTIAAPAEIVLTPEPGSLTLLALGLGLSGIFLWQLRSRESLSSN